MADSIDTGDEQLAGYIRQFNDSADITESARKASEIWRDYVDNKHWSDDELATLEKRGQPAITDNLIKDKVEYLLGMERQTRTDPKAYPRTPKDDEGADAATDALRYIVDCNHFKQTKSKVFDNMIVEGFGGCEVIIEAGYKPGPGQKNPKVLQRYVRWDRLYFDGHSLLPDFSDSRYQGIVVWMDADEAKSKYPAISEGIEQEMTGKSLGVPTDTYDDRPRWFDRKRKRIQILEHYFKRGDEWYRVVFSKYGVLEPEAKSVYIDSESESESGKPECPLILQSLYVDRLGNRYGVVARYKDLQDEVNKRRSKMQHLLNVAQVTAERGAVDDIEQTRREIARPDGYIEYAPGTTLEIHRNTDLSAGQAQLLLNAQTSLHQTGPNAALLGQTGDISGRAKQIDQNGGVVQLGILFDSLRYWQTRVMRATWNRVKQYWTAEQWIRVTDDEKTKFMALNSTYPPNHQMAGLPMNQVAQMDLDIIIDEMPDVVTIEQEQFKMLMDLAPVAMQAGKPIPLEVLIEASGLRNKQKLIDMIDGGGEKNQIPPQVQQQIQAHTQQLQAVAQAQAQKEQELQQQSQALEMQKAQAQAAQAKLDARASEIKSMQQLLEARSQMIEVQGHAQKMEALATAAKVDLTQAQTEKVRMETEVLSKLPDTQDKGVV